MTDHESLKAKFRADHARKPIVQAAARVTAQTRQQSVEAERLTRFENAHPCFINWWKDAKPGNFEHSLRSAVMRYGQLTERQHVAAIASIETSRKAPTVDVSKIDHVFAVALKNGIKRPKLRMGSVVFALGRPGSSYENTIFVNDRDRNYLGRLVAGKFSRGKACSDEQAADVLKAGTDPLEAAVAYGKVTGECAICGRTLENADSIARGIGPICAEKVFG